MILCHRFFFCNSFKKDKHTIHTRSRCEDFLPILSNPELVLSSHVKENKRKEKKLLRRYCNTLMDIHSYCIITRLKSRFSLYIHAHVPFNYVNLFSHACTHSSLNLIYTHKITDPCITFPVLFHV